MLYVRAFGECERIFDIDAEVPNGALDFRMACTARRLPVCL